MKNGICTILTGALICLSIPVTASTDADAQKFICVTLMTFDCGTDGIYNKGAAHSIDVSLFFRIKFADKKVVGILSDGSTRTSDIALINRDDDGIYLYGNQKGRSWSANIVKDSGAMSATVSGDNEAFVIFGRCTPDD